MKEATGNANITVITILLIGFVMITGSILVPRLMKNSSNKSCCTEKGGTMLNNKCYYSDTCEIDSTTGKITKCTKEITLDCK